MDHRQFSRRVLIQAGAATTAFAGIGVATGKPPQKHARRSLARDVLTWNDKSTVTLLSPAARRAVDAALNYGDRLEVKETELIMSDESMTVDDRACFFVAVRLRYCRLALQSC